MSKIMLLSAAALALSSPAAYAADIVPSESVPDWTALHIGIGGGAGYDSYDIATLFDIEGERLDIDADENEFHGFGTVEIGADYQFEGTAFVLGILASYDFNGSSQAQSSATAAAGEDGFITAEIQSELEDTWFVGGRAGFVVNDTSLLYGLGGYSWAKAKAKWLLGIDFGGGDDTARMDEDEAVDGLTLGAGLEQRLNESISLKIEYRHDFLGSIKWDEAPFDPGNTASGELDFSRDTLRAVLSWRFGMRGP